MNDAVRTLVIIPTYCEIDMIAASLERVRAALPSAHVLVVDDASPDGTADVVREQQVLDPSIFLLSRTEKSGLGPAYIDGFRWAMRQGYQVVVEMDADGSHDALDLPRLTAGLSQADLVIGSRWISGGATVGWSSLRKAISRLGNLYARGILRIPVADATSGYRAFAVEPLRSCLDDDMASHGYGFQVEMVWRFHRAGFRVLELPIVFREREAGASKMSISIIVEAAVQIVRWRFGYRAPTTR